MPLAHAAVRDSRNRAAALQYQGLAQIYHRPQMQPAKIEFRLAIRTLSGPLISAMPVRFLTGANRKVTFDRPFRFALRRNLCREKPATKNENIGGNRCQSC
jgi:hypothetical protein